MSHLFMFSFKLLILNRSVEEEGEYEEEPVEEEA